MAGASLAAAIGSRARVVLVEAESQPGYHTTGRSAAFWSESYGGPVIQPLTTASGPWLQAGGYLNPRTCVHVADEAGRPALAALIADLDLGGIDWTSLDRAGLEATVSGLATAFAWGVREPTVCDIDVGRLHADYLTAARRAGAVSLVDAAVLAAESVPGGWHLETRAGTVDATILVNAAGAWADQVAGLAGVRPLGVQPYRRTVVQIATDPPAPSGLPLVMDAEKRFYFKPEPGGRLWLSPHDESPMPPNDVAPEELDIAIAIDRFEHVVDWRVLKRERAWAGLRSFAPDRAPVYGFDPARPGFFWFAGQGGFGIQTAPAAAAIGAALLLAEAMPAMTATIDVERFAPERF
ncbi:NAD(P)/FAD-dependent oxidoreductase [Sphingomonas sp. MMS24-J13]|uniref:NAD(P)/FAD-dependent oxidoreductase n=1 Tax=Sphingomonas sp. MMS24-J13 TaxID=3238686 RepID=UPI00384C1FBA